MNDAFPEVDDGGETPYVDIKKICKSLLDNGQISKKELSDIAMKIPYNESSLPSRIGNYTFLGLATLAVGGVSFFLLDSFTDLNLAKTLIGSSIPPLATFSTSFEIVNEANYNLYKELEKKYFIPENLKPK